MPLKQRLVMVTLLLTTVACSLPANNRLKAVNTTGLAASSVSNDEQLPGKEISTISIADTVARLHRTTADYTDVPVDVAALLKHFKRQLRDLISVTMNEANASSPAAELRARIWDRLTAAGITIGQPRDHAIADDKWESKYNYGDLFDVQVKRPLRHPDLIVVITTLEIPCGRDSSLYIFRKQPRGWQVILAQEANGYHEISGAQGYFDSRIAFESRRRFFVVTVNVTPWCTSNWQTVRYTALRPGSVADEPAVIVSGQDTIYLGVDSPIYKLVVKRKWFSIRFAGEATEAQIMNGLITRNRLIQFRIAEIGR